MQLNLNKCPETDKESNTLALVVCKNKVATLVGKRSHLIPPMRYST